MNSTNRPKNPRRVAAGRLNQLKSRGITDAGRKKLSESAYRTKPWEKSTGPTSEEGKEKVSRNSSKTPTPLTSSERFLAELSSHAQIVVRMNRALIGGKLLAGESGSRDYLAKLAAQFVESNRNKLAPLVRVLQPASD